jgi:hypothetical protein
MNKVAINTLPEAKDLKKMFETAVCELHDNDRLARSVRYRTPIVQRRTSPAPLTQAGAEKRAVSDAARALAQLWKVQAHAR